MADGLKTTIATNREANECASTTDTKVNTITGKYGTASIEGTAPDCKVKYKVNASGVSDRIQGKELVLNIDPDSSKVTKDSWGGDDKYLPTAVK